MVASPALFGGVLYVGSQSNPDSIYRVKKPIIPLDSTDNEEDDEKVVVVKEVEKVVPSPPTKVKDALTSNVAVGSTDAKASSSGSSTVDENADKSNIGETIQDKVGVVTVIPSVTPTPLKEMNIDGKSQSKTNTQTLEVLTEMEVESKTIGKNYLY